VKAGQATSASPPASDGQPRAGAAGPWRQFVFHPAECIAPEEPIYQGLLAKGDLAIWLGREKHRKSNVVLQFAICGALGRDFLHFNFAGTSGLKVLVLDYESKSQTIKNRYEAIATALGLSESERKVLGVNLEIVEMRKAAKKRVRFPRFPVRAERGREAEFDEEVKAWSTFITEAAADLYIIDPMRCMHAQQENDSSIEALLSRVRELFGNAAVVISHHLRKRNRKAADQIQLKNDMRIWADDARGSSAITAHTDVIVCQEREIERGVELLHLGAYLRDGADIEPMQLRESGPESFYWQIAPDLPLDLLECLDVLRPAGPSFANRTAAADVLQNALGSGRSTNFSRIKELYRRGLLVDCGGVVRLRENLDEMLKGR
jgi:AAA domain-containing protein